LWECFLTLGKSPRRQNSDETEIVLLYLLKEYQRLGIGKILFNFAKDIFKKSKLSHFVVYCNKYNKSAQNFYMKMGCEILSVDTDHVDKSLPQIKFICKI